MEVQFGSAKVAKYGVRESGDTLELIERPHGGLSVVLVDGQRSGHAAKRISNIVARKAISLLGEGVRDGAAARAAHDYLSTHRAGQVSAELQMVSADLRTRTLVVSRNSRCPAVIVYDDQMELFDDPSEPIGIHPNTKPVIREVPLAPGTYVVLFTDGLRDADGTLAPESPLGRIVLDAARQRASAQVIADALLTYALQSMDQRPRDDISVLVLCVSGRVAPDMARRMSVIWPLGA